MSVKTSSAVWEHSQAKGSELLLLLAIADFANDDGEAWPSVATLAQKIRMSERNTQYLISKLEARGDLKIAHGQGPKGCNLFTLQTLHRVQTSVARGCKPASKGGAIAIAPEPSLEPSKEPSERETRASSPQNSTATLRLETPPETVRTPAPFAAPLVDMSNPRDPRFTTPFYPAVAAACGIRPEPMQTSLAMRGRIANVAAKFERNGYTVEQVAQMAANWTMPNPPSPDQLFDRADSLLRATRRSTQPEPPESADTRRLRAIYERRAERNRLEAVGMEEVSYERTPRLA